MSQFSVNSSPLAVLILLVLLAFPSTRGRCADKKVDLDSALTIGSNTVSRYLFEKFLNRFASEFRDRTGRAPSPEETSLWIETFIDQQCIIALAEKSGFGTRPSVIEAVDRMEHHMLTHENGPLYDYLYRKEAPDSAAVVRYFAQSCEERNVFLAHFNDPEDVTMPFGLESRDLPVIALVADLQTAGTRGHAQILSGWHKWPFSPFTEVADATMALHPGEWHRLDIPMMGTYFVAVIDGRTKGTTSLTPPKDFAELVDAVERKNCVIRHRQKIIQESHFSLCREVANSAMRQWRANQTINGRLPDMASPIDGRALFTFIETGVCRTVSVKQFVDDFNAQLIRRIPSSLNDLIFLAEEYVVSMRDLSLSRELRINEAEKFVEDRKGFRGYQILAQYSAEVIRPQIEITEDDVVQYLRENRESAQLKITTDTDAIPRIRTEIAGIRMRAKEHQLAFAAIGSLGLSDFINYEQYGLKPTERYGLSVRVGPATTGR